MSTQHTPGPLYVGKSGNDADEYQLYPESTGKTIAIVYGKANADLFAAAYDLLAALQRCADHIKANDEDYDLNDYYNGAMAAIAKATHS